MVKLSWSETGCKEGRSEKFVNDIDREERRAHLEQRRAAVAHQLRCLAIELTDLDRQLDDISSRSAEARHPPTGPR